MQIEPCLLINSQAFADWCPLRKMKHYKGKAPDRIHLHQLPIYMRSEYIVNQEELFRNNSV